MVDGSLRVLYIQISVIQIDGCTHRREKEMRQDDSRFLPRILGEYWSHSSSKSKSGVRVACGSGGK